MDLRTTHNQVFINLATGQEGRKTASANHIRCRIPITIQIGYKHFRNKTLKGAEMMSLVMETLDIRFATEFPAGPQFIVFVLVTE